MDRKTFPGFRQMTVSEVKVWGKMLSNDGYTPNEILDYIEGIDECLSLQASASLINKRVGKAKQNRMKAKDIIYERACLIPIPERFLNNEE